MSGLPFEFDIHYSRKRRTIAIIIRQGQVKVRAPHYASEHQVMQFVQQKQHWIANKLQHSKPDEQPPTTLDLDGGRIPWLGNSLSIAVNTASVTRHHLSADKLTIDIAARVKPENKLNALHNQIEAFYKQQAQSYLSDRVEFWSQQTQLHPESVAIKTYKARWGSCDRLGHIQLNWKLMRLEPQLIDYVVVHELCHLVHFDHSPAFWDLVSRHYPSSNSCKAWFKRYGNHFLD